MRKRITLIKGLAMASVAILVGVGVAYGATILSGTSGVDTIDMLEGDDVFDFGDGNDWMTFNEGNDVLWFGEGDDAISFDAGSAYIWGPEIWTTTGQDYIFFEDGPVTDDDFISVRSDSINIVSNHGDVVIVLGDTN